jgi:hypothetical protein
MTNYIRILRALLEWHQWITLAANVMFVNGVPFLVSVLRDINLVPAVYSHLAWLSNLQWASDE